MAHNPEDSAGAQLAMIVALKLLLSVYRADPAAATVQNVEMECMRADPLASNSLGQKLHAFNEMADALLDVLRHN